MIAAKPFGLIRSLFFFSGFLVARVPFWFILLAFLYNGFITGSAAAMLICSILFCRGYIESEIAGSGFLLFTAIRIYRFFATLFSIIILYCAMIYFGFFADAIDKLLIASALMILLLLNFSNVKNGYWQGYRTPFRVTFITTLLWLYLAFIPDTILGNIAALIAIYIMEFINLYDDNPLGMKFKADNSSNTAQI